jgi:opacity protein-like surface antigen
MKRPLAIASTVVAAAAPAAAAAKKDDHVRGCSTTACDKRIGKRWARKHRARAAALTMRQAVAPFRAWLDRVGECEDNDDPGAGPTGYQSNTGNGFYGRYQFTLSSWAAVGGHGMPSTAPPLEQDYRAVRLLKLQGPGAWPVCAR